MKWFIQEYRHESLEGKYYLKHILSIWYSGLRVGLAVGLIPLVAYWILR